MQIGNGVNEETSKDILIHFLEGTSLAERDAYIEELSGQLLLWIEQLNVAKVRVAHDFGLEDANGGDIADRGTSVVQGATSNAIATMIEEDGTVYGTVEPNDPDLYDEQRVYTAELLGLFDAWDYEVGRPDVVVAVLDTGITSDHPEFSGRIRNGYDFYNNDDDPNDDHGHGTHVSGTIAAAINNGIGGAGLCGGCSILPIKVLNQNNAGTWSGVAAGITYAADNGAHIIVMSLGSTSGTKVVEDAIDYALAKDVLIIAAAGNANSNRDFYPAAYDDVIGVAATNQNDERWVLSNYGDYIDISAPGHVIYSTYRDLNNSYDGHVFMSGTSMATPHVGGLAGLLKSQDPARTSAEITDILLNSALDLGEPGRDEHFGMGRIDPTAALTYEQSVSRTAVLGGTLWQDADADGSLDTTERGRISGADITLYDANDRVVSNTKSNDSGDWQITNLKAGAYRISVETAEPDLILTTVDQGGVSLKDGQKLTSQMIGFVDELPVSVVQGISARRQADKVIITWDVASDLVTGVNLERAIGTGDFQQIKSYDLTLSGAVNSPASFDDTLPDGVDEMVIRYRIQVTPGETYVRTIQATVNPIITIPIVTSDPQPDNPERAETANTTIYMPLMYAP